MTRSNVNCQCYASTYVFFELESGPMQERLWNQNHKIDKFLTTKKIELPTPLYTSHFLAPLSPSSRLRLINPFSTHPPSVVLSISSPFIFHPSENTRKSNANLPKKSECRFIVHISCVMLSRAEKRVEVNSGVRRSREVVCGWNTVRKW